VKSEMKAGDLIEATWPDGLTCQGTYTKYEQGYIILHNQKKRIICNENVVKFKIIKKNAK
jgi:hypothetical protein